MLSPAPVMSKIAQICALSGVVAIRNGSDSNFYNDRPVDIQPRLRAARTLVEVAPMTHPT
jgi:hypothetical protein